MKLLLIGASGYWGKIYLKTLQSLNIKVRPAGRKNWRQLISKYKYDGIIISTPIETHVEIALACWVEGLPVLLEKPVAPSLQSAEPLFQIMTDAKVMVDYIHLFSPAYQKVKQSSLHFTQYNIRSVNYGIGPNANDPNFVLMDRGVHSISMILDLINEEPKEIICQAFQTGVVSIDLIFENVKARIDISHSSEIKEFSFVADGVEEYKEYYTYLYRGGKQIFKKNDQEEIIEKKPLEVVIESFRDFVGGKEEKRSGWELSKRVMNVLERCKEVMKKNY